LKQQNKRRGKLGLKFFYLLCVKKDLLPKGVFKRFVQYWMTSCVLESLKSYSCFQGIQGMQAMVEERAEEVRTEEPQVHRQTDR
jgi:hypothetical protein